MVEKLLEFALAATDYGSHDGDAFTGPQLKDALHDLLGGLARDRTAAVGAMRRAHGGVEQAKIVVNLGNCSHGGAWAATGGFLLDGDCRAQALDGVHVGAFDLVEKLRRVG